MNKEKFIANWDNLTPETKTNILALASKEIEKGYPEKEEAYYHYTITIPNCEVIAYSEIYNDSALDRAFISAGNYFRTHEEAIFAGNCDYYTKQFEAYVRRYSEKLDWQNTYQNKYYPCYDYSSDYILYIESSLHKKQHTIYASDEQILIDAIDHIGKDNFLKYVMEVEK